MHKPSPLLTLPDDRYARWALLELLIAQWHEPMSADWGYTTEELSKAEHTRGFPIPKALSEWYAKFGKLDEAWSRNDIFIAPEEIFFENNAFIFYVENQAVVKWGIPSETFDQVDPPVFVQSLDIANEWVNVTDSLSKFAVYMFAYQLRSIRGKPWIYGFAQPSLAQIISERFPRLELPRAWWAGYELFGYNELIISNDGTDHVHACAMSDESLSTFVAMTTQGNFEVLASSGEWH